MKKIRVKNEMEEVAVALPMDLGEGSDDDDLGGGDIKMAGVAGEEDDEDSEGSSFVLAFFPLLSSLSLSGSFTLLRLLSFFVTSDSADGLLPPKQSTRISKPHPIRTAEDQERNQEMEMTRWMAEGNSRKRRRPN